MECSCGNSVKFVLVVTPKILAQSPKIWKILFLLETCPSEYSAGHLECLPNETGVLLPIKISSQGPWKNINLYLLPKNFFAKSATGHVEFSFDTLVENVRQRLELLYFESANRVRIMFFFRRRSILSQSVSLETWNAILTNLLKVFSQETGFSLLIPQRSKSFGFSQNFFLEMFRWSRRMPIRGTWSFLASQNFLGKTIERYKSVSSSRKSFFEMFLSSRRFRFGHPCRKLLPKIQKFFLENQQTDSNLCFLSKKNVLSQSVSLDTWNAKLTTLPKLFRQETVFFWLIAQRSKCFGFSENFFLEMFRWTRRMPIRGTWSFLASQNFQTKILKWYKVVSSSRKTFLKMFL